MINPFRINISNKDIDSIYDKVKKFPWDAVPNIDGWDLGTNLSYIKEISKYWIKDFQLEKTGRKDK